MSNILYLSTHEILEADEISLFTEQGHNVFSMGAYQNSNRGGTLRGEVKNLYQNEELKHIGLECSKENIRHELIDWADYIIVMHNPPIEGSPYAQTWIVNNWPMFKYKKVVWRSIGQSISRIEKELSLYRDQGLKIIRYSPRERTIPFYAGEDAIIRFYKDPEEYKGWTGENKVLINFSQSMKQRADDCGYKQFMQVSQGFNTKVYGPGNESFGDMWGGCVSHDEQKKVLRESRVYFYFGTAPASYTLALMEAMMTGIPVVAAGPKFSENRYPDQKTNEIEDIIKNGENGFVSNDVGELRKDVALLIKDDELAKRIGEAGRKTAINLWDKSKISQEWKQFFEQWN